MTVSQGRMITVVSTVVAALLVLAPAVADASLRQSPDPTDSSSTTSTTTPSSSGSTTTTTTPGTTTTTLPGDPPPPVDLPDEHVDSEPPPEPPVPVPPRGPTTAPSFDSAALAARRQAIEQADEAFMATLVAHRIAVAQASAQLSAAQTSSTQADGALGSALRRRSRLDEQVRGLSGTRRRAIRRLADAKVAVQEAAVAAYTHADNGVSEVYAVLSSGDDINAAGATHAYARTVGERTIDAIRRYRHVRARTADELVGLAGQVAAADLAITAAQSSLDQAKADVVRAFDALTALGADPQNEWAQAAEWRFPIAGKYNFTDTWGATRSGGRHHEGTDVFAAWGTPVVAIERGVISKISHNGLGGTILWLKGESGNSYYYAHLSAYAVGLTVGQVVNAGDLVAYVGNTGDAISTPPHLHFELHPAGQPVVNSYPLLRAIAEADLKVPPPPYPYAPLQR